jgi:hypothetical protein
VGVLLCRCQKISFVEVGRAVGHHLPEQNKEAPARSRASTQ